MQPITQDEAYLLALPREASYSNHDRDGRGARVGPKRPVELEAKVGDHWSRREPHQCNARS